MVALPIPVQNTASTLKLCKKSCEVTRRLSDYTRRHGLHCFLLVKIGAPGTDLFEES